MAIYGNLEGTFKNDFTIGKSSKINLGNDSGEFTIDVNDSEIVKISTDGVLRTTSDGGWEGYPDATAGTGTISTTGTTLTGSGTSFSDELQEGSIITADNEDVIVSSITDDTNATLIAGPSSDFSGDSFTYRTPGVVYSADNQRFGVGTYSPNGKFDMCHSGGVTNVVFRCYSNNAGGTTFRIQKGRGTISVPADIESGDLLGRLFFEGYETDGMKVGINLQGMTTEDWTSTDRGSKLILKTTANGTTTLQDTLTLDQDASATFIAGVSTTISDTTNQVGLTINQNDVTNNPVALQINNTGTGDSLNINTTDFIIDSDGNVGIGITPVSGCHLALPQEDDSATPTLAFGDGNSGFYESADNTLMVAINGNSVWEMSGSYFGSDENNRPVLVNEDASITNPTLVPRREDPNTGIGWGAADELSIITGATSAIYINSSQKIGINDTGPDVRFSIGDSQIGAVPTDANIGVHGGTPDANILLGVGNINDSATYTGLSFETRSTNAARGLIAFEHTGTAYQGEFVFKTRDASNTSREQLKLGISETAFNEDGDDVDFRVEGDNNTHALFVQGSDDYVGVGITPVQPLHAYHASVNTIGLFESGDANAYISLKDSNTTNSQQVMVGATTDDMVIWAGGAEAIRIDTDQNVGINNDNPIEKLTVNASNSGTAISNNAGIWIKNTNDTNDTWSTIYFSDSSNVGAGAVACQLTDTTNNYGEVAIATNGAGGLTEKMRVTQEGRVNIAGQVYSPLEDLGIVGTTETVDFDSGNIQYLILDENLTLSFTNEQSGASYTLILKQDATGGNTVAFPTNVHWSGGGDPTITSTGNAKDIVTLIYSNVDSEDLFYASIIQDVKA